MIGGSGYAFPKYYLSRYPNATIDVVEIDPGLTALAREHFNLPDDERLKIYHEDGRTFINKCDNKYDAVFMDAWLPEYTIEYKGTTLVINRNEKLKPFFENKNYSNKNLTATGQIKVKVHLFYYNYFCLENKQ